MQLVTGLWLAKRWIGDWSNIFSKPTSHGHLILFKLTLLIINVELAGFTYQSILRRVEERGLRAFALLSGALVPVS